MRLRLISIFVFLLLSVEAVCHAAACCFYPVFTPLSQPILDAIANPNTPSVVVPHGRYTLPIGFKIERSNLVLDFSNSTIFIDAALTNQTSILLQSTTAPIVDPLSPSRNASHLTGTITAATTQLTMPEVVDVAPGEVVTIVAGVDRFDPAEPQRYISAEVLSVVGDVVTFTAPLGTDITAYGTEAALKAVTAEAFWPKIGIWGEDRVGNYAKGYGLDHGLLRYVGGKQSNLTIRNVNFEVKIPPDGQIPAGVGVIGSNDIANLTLENFNSHNIVGVMLHTFRGFNVVVNGMTITGEGRQNIGGGFTHVGYPISTWGGDNFHYNDVHISGKNMIVATTEVSPGDIFYNRLIYDMQFVDTWSAGFSAGVFNFTGAVFGGPPQIKDARITISGDRYYLDPGAQTFYEDVVFTQSSMPANFNFANATIVGTLTLNNIVYGPMVTETGHIVSLGTGAAKNIHLPVGFVKSVRARVLSGSLDRMTDGWGNPYRIDGQWQAASEHVGGNSQLVNLPPGDQHLIDYFTGLQFTAYDIVALVQIEFDVEYWPRAGGAGWVLN